MCFLYIRFVNRVSSCDIYHGPAARRAEPVQQNSFWNSDKAVLVMTGNRQVWLESTSNPSLTLRPPHGSVLGVDLVRGHFVTEELWRSKLAGVR